MSKVVIDRAVVEQEPVAVVTGYYGGFPTIRPLEPATVLPFGMALYAHPQPPRQQPQVEQEPVAWAVMQDGAICWEADYPFSNEPGWCDSDQQSVPLYTHPQNLNCKSTQARLATLWGYEKLQPPRQPLTREAIDAIIKSNFVSINDQNLYDAIYLCMRDVESAHDIEEQK